MLTRTPDPNHRQRAILSLTEKSIALAPVLIEIGYWGASFLSTNPGLCIPATMLHEGGRELAEELMGDLRHLHLGHSRTAMALWCWSACGRPCNSKPWSGAQPPEPASPSGMLRVLSGFVLAIFRVPECMSEI